MDRTSNSKGGLVLSHTIGSPWHRMTSHRGQQTPACAAEVFLEDIPGDKAPEQPSLLTHTASLHRLQCFSDTLRGRMGMSGGDRLRANPVLCGWDLTFEVSTYGQYRDAPQDAAANLQQPTISNR